MESNSNPRESNVNQRDNEGSRDQSPPRSYLRSSRRKFLALGSGTALSTLAGCTGGFSSQEVQEVSVATPPVAGFAPIWVADERGFYGERNIELQWERITGGARATPQLGTGELDAVGGSVGASTFNSIAQGVPINIVADAARWFPNRPTSLRFYVSEQHYSEGMRFSDMPEGFTYAWNTEGSSADYLTGRLLQINDMSWDDLEVTSMPFPDMIAAMSEGGIDACVIPDPLGLQLEGRAGAGMLRYCGEVAPEFNITVILYGQPFLNQRRDVAVDFLEAYLLGVREYVDLGGYPNDEVANIISDRLEIPADAIKASIPTTIHQNGQVNVDSIMKQQEYHACRGFLDQTVPEDDIFNNELLDEALDNVGRLDEDEAIISEQTIEEWSNDSPRPYPPVGEIETPEGFPADTLCE